MEWCRSATDTRSQSAVVAPIKEPAVASRPGPAPKSDLPLVLALLAEPLRIVACYAAATQNILSAFALLQHFLARITKHDSRDLVGATGRTLAGSFGHGFT